MKALVRAFLVLLVFHGLGGCANGTDPDPVPAPAPAADDVVRLGLTDWTIETGETIPAGDEVTILVTNAGATAHDVLIRGEHGIWGTPVLSPGQTHEVQITAEPGEVLELVCTVTGHRAAGMHTQVSVAGTQE